MRLLFMGTGPFAVPCFDEIVKHGRDEVALVVTKPELPGQRGELSAPSPVAIWAETYGLRVEKPLDVNDPATIAHHRDQAVNLLIVCDYGRILSKAALAAARLGGINLHGSLLPRHRGAAPVNWAVWKGDAETGITVILMSPKLDAGPTLVQRRTPIGAHETAEDLETRLAEMGRGAVIDALDLLRDWDGEQAVGQPQDASLATPARRLKKADGHIDWSRSSEHLLRQFRALQPWPGVFTFVPQRKGETRVLVQSIQLSALDRPGGATPGEVIAMDDAIHVATGDGMLALFQLQPAGKRSMAAEELIRGRTIQLGQRLT